MDIEKLGVLSATPSVKWDTVFSLFSHTKFKSILNFQQFCKIIVNLNEFEPILHAVLLNKNYSNYLCLQKVTCTLICLSLFIEQ